MPPQAVEELEVLQGVAKDYLEGKKTQHDLNEAQKEFDKVLTRVNKAIQDSKKEATKNPAYAQVIALENGFASVVEAVQELRDSNERLMNHTNYLFGVHTRMMIDGLKLISKHQVSLILACVSLTSG